MEWLPGRVMESDTLEVMERGIEGRKFVNDVREKSLC